MKTTTVVPLCVAAVSLAVSIPRCAANPIGGAVAAGSATITGQGTALTTINQTGNQVIINWQNFSIGAGEVTQFIQPSANASALNRVLSGNPSEIFGELKANGQVFVINPNGILVGASGKIDTKSFVASTLDIPNANFLSGGGLTLSGNSTASVENQGTITALGGDVFLIGNTVRNSGTILAPQGTVGLAAGSQVQLVQAGNERLSVLAGNPSTSGASTGVDNSGTIGAATAELKAAGGNIYALAINNGGVVRATGIVNENGHIYLRAAGANIQNSGTIAANNADGSGGSIVVDGGHNATSPSTVINSGVISAAGTAPGTAGGSVEILGDDVGLFDNAEVDVSGDAGGGTALIGGDEHGANAVIQDAEAAYVSAGSQIKADAVSSGNGGKVVVWSDNSTRFYGTASARGGANGGNGGFMEVSGEQFLDFRGGGITLAPRGQSGTLLLDPNTDLTIDNGSDNNINGTSPFIPSGSPSELTWATISTALGSGNVIVTTVGSPNSGGEHGDVTVAAAPAGLNTGNQLTIQAAREIVFNAGIQNAGAGTLALDAQGANGGVAISQTAGTLQFNTLHVNAPAGSVSLNQGNSVGVLQVSAAGGAVGFTDAANLDVQGISAAGQTVTLTGSGSPSPALGESSGTITAGTLSLGGWGTTLLSQANQVGSFGVTSAGGSVGFVNGASLSVQNVSAAGQSVSLTVSGDNNLLTIASGKNVSGSSVALAADRISVAGTVTATGTASLSESTAARPITLGTAGVNMATASGGTLGLTTTDIGNITAGTLQVGDANSGNLSVTHAFTLAAPTTLQSGGAISQGSGDTLTSSPLVTLQAGGTITLNEANQVSALSVTGAGGAVQFTDAAAALDVQGINAAGQTVTLTGSASPTLTESAGTITAGTLSLGGWGTATLNKANQVGNFSVTSAGGAIKFTDASPLIIQGISDAGQTVTLTGSGGPTLNELVTPITAGTLSLGGWGATTLNLANQVGIFTVTSVTGPVAPLGFENAANLDVQGINAPGQTVTLTGSGTPTLGESTGTISAGTLSLGGWGATTLNQANQVGNFVVTSASGSLGFTDATSLNVQNVPDAGQSVSLTVSGDNNELTIVGGNNVSGSSVTLAADRMNVAGTVTATGTATLHESTTGRVITVGTDDVNAPTAGGGTLGLTSGEIGNVTAGTLQVGDANSGNLTVTATVPLSAPTTLQSGGNISIGAFINPAGTLTLVSGGSISQGSGDFIISGSALTLQAGTTITLNDPNNQISALSVTGAGGAVQFTDSAALDVQGISAPGQTVTLTATGSPFSLTESAGVINAGTLSLNGWGTTTLNQNNQVGSLQVAGAAGALSFGDTVALAVQGLIAPGQTVTLNGNNLALTEPAGPIVAGTLSLGGWGTTTLNQPNQVGTLTVTGASGSVAFQDVASLAVGGIIDPGQTVTLTGIGDPTLSEPGAPIVAGTLSLGGWGPTTLGQANQAAILKVTSAVGPFDFADSVTLDAQGISDPGQTVTLTGLGSPTLNESTGTINAGALSLGGWGATTLGQANQVPVLALTGGTGGMQFNDADPLSIVTANETGNLTLTSAGAISQTGAINVSGPASFTSTGAGAAGDITLGIAGNSFGSLGLSSANGSAVSAITGGPLVLDMVSVNPAGGGTLAVTSGGDITQAGGRTVSVGGVATFAAPGGNSITLGNAGNSFNGAVNFVSSGGGNLQNVTVADTLALNLPALTLNGSLTASSAGAITEAGPLNVLGPASFSSTGAGANGDITLANAGNTFGSLGLSTANGSAVSAAASGALALDNVSVNPGGAGTLTATASGPISQVATKTVNVGGLASFTSTGFFLSGNITLDNAGNTFGSLGLNSPLGFTVSATAPGPLALDNVSINIGTLTVTAGGDITQVAGKSLFAGGNATFTVPVGNSILVGNVNGAGSPLNTFNGGVTFLTSTPGNLLNLAVSDTLAYNVPALTLNGALTVISGGAINQLGTLVVPNLASFTSTGAGAAGDITLPNAGNSFGSLGLSAANGSAVTATTVGATMLNNVADGGALAITSGGDITQAGGTTVAVNGLSTFTAPGTHSIILGNAGNTFNGPVNFFSSGGGNLQNVTILDAAASPFTIPALTLNGTLTVNSDGAVGEVGPLIASGLSVTAAGPVTLLTGNQVTTLSGSVTGAGGFSLSDAVPLTVGTVSGVTGLTTTGGNITLQDGSLTINQQIKSGNGNITLQADTMNITAPVISTKPLPGPSIPNTILEPLTATTINIGSVGPGLSLTKADLNEITGNILTIGNSTVSLIIGEGNATTLPAPNVNSVAFVNNGGTSTITVASSDFSALSTVVIPPPQLNASSFSSASLSVDEVSKILPPGSIGTLWLELPFETKKEKRYRVEDLAKWVSGPIASVGTTGGTGGK